MSNQIITINIAEDYHFKNVKHSMNFLAHLFISDPKSITGFKSIEGGICINGKCYLLNGEKSIPQRQQAYNIAITREIDFQNCICKSNLITFSGGIPDHEDFEETCGIISDIIKKNDNITYFCASYHPYQWWRYSHFHLFYTSLVDVKDELRSLIIEYFN